MKNSILKITLVLLLALVGCQPAPRVYAPSDTVSFVFIPPKTEPLRSDMAIGILKTTCIGNIPYEVQYYDSSTGSYIRTPFNDLRQLLNSAQTDLGKMFVAKGFPTTEAYTSIDEMTYSQKQRALLVLQSTFEIVTRANPAPGLGASRSATASGTASIDLIEPFTRERIWVKRLALDPITIDEPKRELTIADIVGPGSITHRINGIEVDTLTKLLTAFYDQAMHKLWDHLDPREIANLKAHVVQVRKNSTHIAK